MKKTIFLITTIVFLLLQLVPVDRNTHPELSPISASPQVTAILERSCYDCHSMKTNWPWYSYIFPISVLTAKHVVDGRTELNFSEWENLSLKKKATATSSIIEEIEEGEMPLYSYAILHPKSKLSVEDIEILKAWANQTEEAYDKEE
ncbi:MAG: heme-binding domain-containing protein [Leptospira sp.]|nr:heme-binding domain-containing protein [Leptospira sp.]